MLYPCLRHLLSSVVQGVLGVWEVQGLVPDGCVEHRFHEVCQALRHGTALHLSAWCLHVKMAVGEWPVVLHVHAVYGMVDPDLNA